MSSPEDVITPRARQEAVHALGDVTSESPATVADRADDLRIVHVRTLGGPNVWRLAPVVLGELRVGSLAERAPDDVPGFNDRLLAAVPGSSDVKVECPSSWSG